MSGEATRINPETVQGRFLQLADEAVISHLGGIVKINDGTAWDNRPLNEEPYIPFPRGSQMLIVTRYEDQLRDPEAIVDATYLFPVQQRKVEVRASDVEEKYEDFWYRRILEYARNALSGPGTVGVQAFRTTRPLELPSPPYPIISISMDEKKRYAGITIIGEVA